MSVRGEPTADGRYLVIDGRRWRATDPAVPKARRDELQRVLMAWRREVKAAKRADDDGERLRAARAGVQATKVALGERGTPWWEQTDAERRERWETDVPAPDGMAGSAGSGGAG